MPPLTLIHPNLIEGWSGGGGGGGGGGGRSYNWKFAKVPMCELRLEKKKKYSKSGRLLQEITLIALVRVDNFHKHTPFQAFSEYIYTFIY